MAWKLILIILLVLAVSISPRLHIGSLGTGRSVDLRYEDFLILLILIIWIAHLCMQDRKKIYVSPLFKPIMIYTILATLSTCMGVILGYIVPSMAIFFYIKEVQYFLTFAVIINFIKTYNDLMAVTYTLLLCAIANGVYSLYQIVSGKFLAAAAGYYGIASIGELSSFSTGGYFAIVFLLSTAVFLTIKRKNMKLVPIISVVLTGIGLLASGSRANVVGAILSLPILMIIIFKDLIKNKRIIYMALIVIGISIAFYYFVNIASVNKVKSIFNRITDVDKMKTSLVEERAKPIFTPLLDLFQESPLFGFGKTFTTTIVGGTWEAHNYYLRILVEMGIFGLMSFLYMLFSIIRMSLKLILNNQFALAKGLGLGCLSATLSLMIASVAQDAFLTVKVNEIFWISVGLSASAYKLNSLKDQVKIVYSGEMQVDFAKK